MTGYDPLPDLADLAVLCYANLLRDRYNATRETMQNLVHGLGLEPSEASSTLAWLHAIHQAVAAADPQVHVVPQGLDAGDAMRALADAKPGDVLREAATGTEWVRTGHNTWLRRPGTKGADSVLTCVELLVTGRREVM